MQDRVGHVVLEQGIEQAGDGRFADPSQSQRGEGDAQLCGRDVRVQIVDDPQQALVPPVSFGGQGRYAGTAHGHQGKFRSHEKAVGQHQKYHQKQRRQIGRARVGKECRSRWSPYH